MPNATHTTTKPPARARALVGATITLVSALVSAETGFQDCETCPQMVIVPAGAVTIGSPATEIDRKDTERPPVRAELKAPFALSKTEITRAQYRDFVAATSHVARPAIYQGKPLIGCNYFDGAGYGYVAEHSWQSPGYPQGEAHPVVCVSWTDAQAFADWLSQRTGREYRLPSAVEFEYAARAGSDAPWHWGVQSDQACEFANIGDRTFLRRYPQRPAFPCDDGYLYTAPVGRFQPNDFGLHDMVGNVWEWTADCWHDDWSGAPADGSPWLEADNGQCDFRVPKGGSWISGIGWSRAGVRSRDGAEYRSFMLGFRVAAAAPAQPR